MKIIYVDSAKWGRKEILVDDEDYDMLSRFNWSVNKPLQTFYAIYATRKNNIGVAIKMHRLILGISDPNTIVHHIDHNGLNNQKAI